MKLKDSDLKVQFKLTNAEAAKLDRKFEDVVSKEKTKFSIEKAKEEAKARGKGKSKGKAKEKVEEPTEK